MTALKVTLWLNIFPSSMYTTSGHLPCDYVVCLCCERTAVSSVNIFIRIPFFYFNIPYTYLGKTPDYLDLIRFIKPWIILRYFCYKWWLWHTLVNNKPDMVPGHVVPETVSSGSAPRPVTSFITVLTVLERLVWHIEGGDHKPLCCTHLNKSLDRFQTRQQVQHDNYQPDTNKK